jgi:lipopolysaccharide export LptBFGC system permease protein LptF
MRRILIALIVSLMAGCFIYAIHDRQIAKAEQDRFNKFSQEAAEKYPANAEAAKLIGQRHTLTQPQVLDDVEDGLTVYCMQDIGGEIYVEQSRQAIEDFLIVMYTPPTKPSGEYRHRRESEDRPYIRLPDCKKKSYRMPVSEFQIIRQNSHLDQADAWTSAVKWYRQKQSEERSQIQKQVEQSGR